MSTVVNHRRLRTFAASLLLIAATSVTAAPQPSMADKASSLASFKSPYDRLMKAVETGRADRETGQTATSLWLSLREELLTLDTRIAALKLELAQGDAAARERALDELMVAAAARERVLTRHVRALDDLTRTAPVAGAAPTARRDGITIEFVPANALSGETN